MAAPPPLIVPAPPAGGWRGHPLFSLENLYRAYRRCRRRKRRTHNALAFERRLEDNLCALREELESGRYRPGGFVAFLLETPKRREIFAADFRDRVVHHVLAGHLEPRWERRFIHDSYACRKGKGTLAAVERLRSFIRKATTNGTRAAFYLQLDVKSFFVSLDRMVLWRRLMARERDPAVRWLTAIVLFQAPTEKCRFRGAERSDFERLPPGKSLFHAPPQCGLPIGNLTSQFWANVYLDELDQFVKHRLKASFYVRYCDDMVLLSAERAELEAWERSIQAFLAERLHLELNQRRRLRPVSDGIDFLGFIVRADYLLVRRRVVSALRERLGRAEAELVRLGLSIPGAGRDVFPWPWALLQGLRQSLNSSLSHLGRASSHRLILALRRRFHWLDEYFTWAGDKVVYHCAVPREAFRLSEQRAWFGECLLDQVLMIQQGGFCEVVASPPAERFGRAPEGRAEVR